jgi:hypothetical protein
VIGRSDGWTDDLYRGLRALNDRLHGITVMTFDQLLAQGERLLDILRDQPAVRACAWHRQADCVISPPGQPWMEAPASSPRHSRDDVGPGGAGPSDDAPRGRSMSFYRL